MLPTGAAAARGPAASPVAVRFAAAGVGLAQLVVPPLLLPQQILRCLFGLLAPPRRAACPFRCEIFEMCVCVCVWVGVYQNTSCGLEWFALGRCFILSCTFAQVVFALSSCGARECKQERAHENESARERERETERA